MDRRGLQALDGAAHAHGRSELLDPDHVRVVRGEVLGHRPRLRDVRAGQHLDGREVTLDRGPGEEVQQGREVDRGGPDRGAEVEHLHDGPARVDLQAQARGGQRGHLVEQRAVAVARSLGRHLEAERGVLAAVRVVRVGSVDGRKTHGGLVRSRG